MTLRRDFVFAQDDTEYLETNFPFWESINDAGMLWLLLNEVTIPFGYTVNSATIAINIPSSYPDASLDMGYFHPHLKLADGSPIRNTEALQSINGLDYQRWSRHYTVDCPYIAGVDSIITHIMAVRGWLQREVKEEHI